MAKVIGAKAEEERAPLIYLAGGFRSTWQDRVMDIKPDFRYVDPRTHAIKDEDKYTWWDLNGVAHSNGVIAYLEHSNPGGHNMAFECGFATCLRKPIIFINENDAFYKYVGMIRASARVFYEDFDHFLSDWNKVHFSFFT